MPLAAIVSLQRSADLLPRHPDVEPDRARAPEEAVEVGVGERKLPAVDAEALPDAVAEAEPGVEHGHDGLAPGTSSPFR